MPGYQVRDTCYPTAKQAAQVAASSMAGSVFTDRGRSYFVSVESVTNTSITYVLSTMDSSSLTYTTTQSYSAQPCNVPEIKPEDVLKVVSFGFGAVLTFWLVGYVIGIATGMVKKI